MDQDGNWRGGRPWFSPHCARWGPRPPPHKGGGAPSPIFGPLLLWPNGGCIKIPLGMEVGLSPGDFVLDGDPVPLPKRRRCPQFSAHVYCGQTARWIKMAIGVEVGLGSVHIVLDGDTAPLPKKGAEPPSPIFGPSLLWLNGWMHQHATWYGGRPQPRRLCVRWGPSPYDWYPAPTLLRLELAGHCNGSSLST